MHHFKKSLLISVLSGITLLSCSKKEEEKVATPTPSPTKETYCSINGVKYTPNDILVQKSAYRFSIYTDKTLDMQWYISFQEPVTKSGLYTVGGLNDSTKQVYMFVSDLRKKDYTFDSRSIELEKVKVTIGSDSKTTIEVPEMWMKNRYNANDSCKFSAKYMQ